MPQLGASFFDNDDDGLSPAFVQLVKDNKYGPQGPQGASPAGAQGVQGEASAVAGAQGAQGSQGAQGRGLPAGGAQGQVLTKRSNADLDLTWA